MKRICLTVALVALTAAPVFAKNTRMEKSLARLDPMTRFEQVCDLEAMARIRRDPGAYRPDRAMTNAMSDPSVTGNTLQGSGGAFRSRGKWYQFSFTCNATDDHLKVRSFDYKIGDLIPEEKWESYGLWR